MKKCYMCNEEKELELFCKNKKAKNGITNLCKSCHYKNRKEKYLENERIGRKKLYEEMRLKPEKYQEYLQSKKDYRSINRQRYLFLACRNRAKIENLPFDLEINDIIIPDICPILETKIIYKESKTNLFSPSVDKIIPELGYVKGNIRVISRKANMMKLNASKEELLIFSKNIINYMR